MAENRNIIREIAWRDLFPWLLLVRVFRLAIYPSCLLVAFLGAVVTPLGWRLSAVIFDVPTETKVRETFAKQTVVKPALLEEELALARTAASLQVMAGRNHNLRANVLDSLSHPLEAASQRSPLVFVFNRLTQPLHRMYDSQTSLGGYAFYLFGFLWSLAVWGFCGGIITRMAVMELGREEPVSLKQAVQLTLKRWFDHFTAPLYPILGTVVIALLSLPVGWMLLADVGIVFAGLLWIFVLLGGFIAAILLLWLYLGWPLMYPAISAEETGDSFEAMSRSFAYTFQKPLQYLFYACVAAVLGFVAWSVVDFICVMAIDTAHWSVSWGASGEWVSRLWHPEADVVRSSTEKLGMRMIGGVEWTFLAMNEAFAYSFFWVSAAAIYLLLRFDVDHTEFDEVWSASDAPRYPLPALAPDKSGVPGVPEPSASTPVETKPQMEPNQAE